MRPDPQEFVRVGVRLVAVAAVVGLLVLALSHPAFADAAEEVERAEQVLAQPDPATPEARVEAARQVLAQDARQRTRVLLAGVAESVWSVVPHASPRGLLRSGYRVFREVWEWRDRGDVEGLALDRLEHGAATPDGQALYAELREREVSRFVDAFLDDAGDALEVDDLARAERRLDRVDELRPEFERSKKLRERVSARRAELASAPEARSAPLRSWEAGVLANLLVGRYDAVSKLAVDAPDARLAEALARYLRGEHEQAFEALEGLAEDDGITGETAQSWLEDPVFNPEVGLQHAARSYQLRRTLGWLGGSALAHGGFDPSKGGYRAWKDSLQPLNLALAMPSRVLRGWEPDGTELRFAAERYLRASPEGPRAGDALGWLARTSDGVPGERAWLDGHFYLPGARTPFRSMSALPVLLTRGALTAHSLAGRQELERWIAGGDGLWLRPTARLPEPGDPEDESVLGALEGDAALAVLEALAAGVETEDLRALGGTPEETLDNLRRIDRAVRAGAVLTAALHHEISEDVTQQFRYEFLDEEPSPPFEQLRYEMLGADVAPSLLPRRERRGRVEVSRSLFSTLVGCPAQASCLDRAWQIDGSVYGRLDLDADLHFGARTNLHHAILELELGKSGPHASLVLPVSRWLGLGRWLPVEARFDLSLGGVSAAPSLSREMLRRDPATAP